MDCPTESVKFQIMGENCCLVPRLFSCLCLHQRDACKVVNLLLRKNVEARLCETVGNCVVPTAWLIPTRSSMHVGAAHTLQASCMLHGAWRHLHTENAFTHSHLAQPLTRPVLRPRAYAPQDDQTSCTTISRPNGKGQFLRVFVCGGGLRTYHR